MNHWQQAYRQAIHELDYASAIKSLQGVSLTFEALVHLYEREIFDVLKEVDESLESPGAIWREHVKSQMILDTIGLLGPEIQRLNVENALNHRSLKVILFAPEGESHIIGLRLMSDLLQAAGVETVFTGADLPNNQLEDLIETLKPTHMITSVTNTYHLVPLRKALHIIKSVNPGIVLIGSGRGILHNAHALNELVVKQTFSEVLLSLGVSL